ncbi:MAG TPA: sigma-70 family RNA polymerase sigma factor [Candidatus Angelobacter sp.]
MNRRSKKRINKELAGISSLKDSDIDTSDIPEITDWSQAVVGGVYSSRKTSPARSADSSTFTPRQLPNPNFRAPLSPRTALAEMTHTQLTTQCLQGGAEAWEEFLRRFHGLVVSVAVRAARRWDETSLEVIEDLVQDVYLKLGADNFRILREFESRHDNAFLDFLKVVTANVVYGHFRTIGAQMRGGALGSASIELTSDILHESSDADTTTERAILLEEIDRLLSAVASERDRAIFWLYYRNGLSAKEIASIPNFKLTVKAVESVILRLTKALRRNLVQAPPGHQSQE